ncbi:uncharacterized protein LOC114321784 [Camellia sinensis]|uniref:uncharacterized protein LOC114321784 n=1 Tax=Camellia sinensis TaxID=4442 RepID=UPI00103699E0|nr:uncharacterized protein LOC114321784 [Camellia sinensis]
MKISKKRRYLCQLWDDKTYQEKCQKNKENRFELKVLHTTGSKAFRKVQYDERDKDGKELGLVDLYHKTHFSQKRQAWVHNEAQIRHGCPKGVTPKYSLKPLVPRLSDIKPDIDVEKLFF